MPTYTYRCTKCGDEIEVVQSMSDPPLRRCKRCRGALRRTFNPVGIVLKGPGFYRTDYRSSSKGSSRDASKDRSEDTSKDTSKDKPKDSSGGTGGKAGSGSKDD